jgi:hypothetical protein
LHRIEKENCLNSMIKLLKVPEILCKQSAKIALGLLEELRSSDGIPTRILQHPTSEQALLLIRNSFEETSNRTPLIEGTPKLTTTVFCTLATWYIL